MKYWICGFIVSWSASLMAQAPAADSAALPTAAEAAGVDSSAAAGLEAGEPPEPVKKSDVSDNDVIFRDVAKDLRCPTCTGLSILESDASFSVQIKDQVKEQMDLGKSKDQILQFFTDRYGPWILREPPKAGFNLFAWLIPIGLLCFGPILIWLLVWKRRVTVSTQGVRPNDMIIAEMQESLQRLKRGRH